MSGLGLVPNEIVGYRLKPDWYSWNVTLVKRHGAASKQAGQEYETTLAYCKNLSFAVQWMFDHSLRQHGAELQQERHAVDGSINDSKALLEAVALAKADVMTAVSRLEAELVNAGLRNKDVIRLLGVVPTEAAD